MWMGWPVARILYLFLGIVFLAMFVQVTLYHSRQNFRSPAMWLPVIATPLLTVVALLLVVWNLPALRSVFAVLAAVTGMASLYGTYLHGVGVGQRVEGYTFNNFMVGPPIMLPLLLAALSVLALLTVYLL